MLRVWTCLCLLFSVLAVCGMVLGVWHSPIDLYGHPVPPGFANVVWRCSCWTRPLGIGRPLDEFLFTLVSVAAGAVVVMFLGLYFVYDTVRCVLLSASQHIFAGLKRTRDQKLSSGLMSCQLSLAVTVSSSRNMFC